MQRPLKKWGLLCLAWIAFLITPGYAAQVQSELRTASADGNLWVAHVGGRRVVQLSPAGEELNEIPVPAKAVTSVAFGGPGMADLYIVTADNLDDPAMRGTIFHTTPGVVGLPTPLAAV